MAAPPPAPRGSMSLYADLLDGGRSESGAEKTTAPAPKQPDAPKNPALRFQPVIRRPQQTKAKPKPKLPALPAAATPPSAAATAAAVVSTTSKSSLPSIAFAPPSSRTTLADWTKGGDNDDDEDEDGDGFYGGGGGSGGGGGGGIGANSQKWQQRGGRKRKKKRFEDKHRMARDADAYVDWDELYDPARPTNLEAYLHSDERVSAAIEWKGVLHAHRKKAATTAADENSSSSEKTRRGRGNSGKQHDSDGDTSSSSSSGGERQPRLFNSAFAPPPPAAFAPPASCTSQPEESTRRSSDGDTPTGGASLQPPPPPPPVPLTLADGLVVSKAPVRFESAAAPLTSKDMSGGAEAGADDYDDDDYQPSFAFNAGDDTRPEEQPLPPPPRSNRPGQAGFAARLMAKYGWTKGTGLGADESGIINPLRHKRINTGPGASGPAMGRIVGGQRKKTAAAAAAEAGASTPSPVIVLRNMVDGMPDLAAEVADGQLVQEIGEECGEQYGRIERVYVDVPSQLVFIKFTETVSALRAVNSLNGRIFNGSAITPSFYDADKFEAGIYQ